MLIVGNAKTKHDFDDEEVERVFSAAVKAAIDSGKHLQKGWVHESDQEEWLKDSIKFSLFAETGKNKDTFEMPSPFDVDHLASRILKEALSRSVILQRLQEDWS